MSMELEADAQAITTGPDLTALGKRIEMLRIDRGISKQHLARYAGTSRQQLWRVMTGKSELTGSLRDRLAEALRVEGAAFAAAHRLQGGHGAAPTETGQPTEGSAEPTFDAYLDSAEAIERTLATLPGGSEGRRLKRALLDAIEDEALAIGLPLGAHVFELRRDVVNGER